MAATEFEERLAYIEDRIRSDKLSPQFTRKVLLNFISKLHENMEPQTFKNLAYSFIVREGSINPNITSDSVSAHSFFATRMTEFIYIASEVFDEDQLISIQSELTK